MKTYTANEPEWTDFATDENIIEEAKGYRHLTLADLAEVIFGGFRDYAESAYAQDAVPALYELLRRADGRRSKAGEIEGVEV